MPAREGACDVCTACCLHGIRDPRVTVVAEANWVVIRRCAACGAYWDMQPAAYPDVISLAEAKRRVPDPGGWNDEGDVVEGRVVSRAVVAYIGKGRSAFPRADDAAVTMMAAGVDPAALLTEVRAIVSECLSIEIDWSTCSLAEGGDEARRIMAARRPELDADALDALRWMFTYRWR